MIQILKNLKLKILIIKTIYHLCLNNNMKINLMKYQQQLKSQKNKILNYNNNCSNNNNNNCSNNNCNNNNCSNNNNNNCNNNNCNNNNCNNNNCNNCNNKN